MKIHGAIKAYCHDCEIARSASDCHVIDCPLYCYRVGGEGRGTLAEWIGAVIARCDDCTGHETKRSVLDCGYRGVRSVSSFTRQGCRVKTCPLHEWRDGMTARTTP